MTCWSLGLNSPAPAVTSLLKKWGHLSHNLAALCTGLVPQTVVFQLAVVPPQLPCSELHPTAPNGAIRQIHRKPSTTSSRHCIAVCPQITITTNVRIADTKTKRSELWARYLPESEVLNRSEEKSTSSSTVTVLKHAKPLRLLPTQRSPKGDVGEKSINQVESFWQRSIWV